MITDFKNGVASFIIPHWRNDNLLSRIHLDETIKSIYNQTDDNWNIIIIDDNSPCSEAREYLKYLKDSDPQKIHIIYLDENRGPGIARNFGIEYAYKMNSPIILFNDQDDISHYNRLKRVREKFCKYKDVNVVYSTFKVIDENSILVDDDKISPAIYEILEGHTHDIVEGENSWIDIGIKKNYTNLTSSTAVRTSLAFIEPFNAAKASEDANVWFRYAAHKGRFIYDASIPTLYRIPTHTECSSRARLSNFYEIKAKIDTDGFFKAMEIALENDSISITECKNITVKFYIKLAESLAMGYQYDLAEQQVINAINISQKDAIECLEGKNNLKAIYNKMIDKYKIAISV